MSDNKDNIFGTNPVMLRRSNAPPTSVEASETVDTKIWEEKVYKTICRFGPDGCIADQVLSCFPGVPYSTITARWEALERKGLITCGPDERKGKSGSAQQVRRAKDPEPECNWLVKVSVNTADGKISIQDVTVRANNERKAIILAKRKAVKIKIVGTKKNPEWIVS
jgi:hypothetical protein